MSMRTTTRNEGTAINKYNNAVTEAIDKQHIIAPQYGITSNSPPKGDPPPHKPRKPKSRMVRTAQRPPRQRISGRVVCRMRTKELKLCIEILEAELALVESGQLDVKPTVREAMMSRLTLMRKEKARRDLQDLAKGKVAPTRSFYSIGSRLATAA